MHLAKRSCVLFCLLLFCLTPTSAQTTATNSTKDSIALRQELTGTLILENPDTAILLLSNALQKSITAKSDGLVMEILLALINRTLQKTSYQLTMQYARQTFPYCKTSYDTACYFNRIGSIYLLLGKYVSASENYYESLRHLKTDDEKTIAKECGIYDNLGLLNFRLHQYDKAIYYYNQCEVIARKKNRKYDLGILLGNMSECYTNMHRPDSAKKYFIELMQLSKELSRPDFRAYAYQARGEAFVESGEYEKAVQDLQAAISVSKNLFENIVIESSYYLGESWYHLKKYKEAEDVLVYALNFAAEGSMKDNTIRAYNTLIKIYEATGRYKKAITYIDSVTNLKDSMESAEKTGIIDQLDVKYKTAEKDKQLAQNELLIARQKNKLTYKNILIISISCGILLMIIIAAVVYRNTLNKQKLQSEQIKLMERENKIGILKAAVQSEENERRRLARELHDGIGGMLGAVIMRFGTLHNNIEAISGLTAYSEGMTILTEMGEEIRKTAHNLMPEVLLKQTLPDAISNYCNYVQDSSSIVVDFQYYGTFENLNESLKLNTYRIVQELLKNIIQHAQAKHAFVQLLINENNLTISVEDDGNGFDKAKVRNGIGLHNVQTRVSSLDGIVTLESVLGKGTTVFISFDI